MNGSITASAMLCGGVPGVFGSGANNVARMPMVIVAAIKRYTVRHGR